MTDLTSRPQTVGELMDRPTERAIEMAAARAVNRADSLLSEAHSVSNVTQKELARALHVTEGRISQVLSGESNPRLTTLARYLSALGYALSLDATPTRPELPRIGVRKRRKTKKRQGHTISAYTQNLTSAQGPVAAITLVIKSEGGPQELRGSDRLEHLGELEDSNLNLQMKTPQSHWNITKSQNHALEGAK